MDMSNMSIINEEMILGSKKILLDKKKGKSSQRNV
jgi:hypothetical protein